jgi:hypothetical protein
VLRGDVLPGAWNAGAGWLLFMVLYLVLFLVFVCVGGNWDAFLDAHVIC